MYKMFELWVALFIFFFLVITLKREYIKIYSRVNSLIIITDLHLIKQQLNGNKH